jgi:hypothetical protein
MVVTCCWREKVPGQILGGKYCQTCTYSGSGETQTVTCTDKELQYLQSSDKDGNVLQEPSNEVGPKLFEKGGGVLQFQPKDNTSVSSEDNSSNVE